MDANAKLGNMIIRQDPNEISQNGRLLLNIIERESLVLLNTSQQCRGVITRHRVTKENEEKSALDYMLTCDQLATFLEEMLIDEERNFTLTKYATMKGIRKIVKCDHNGMYGKFRLN